MTLILSLCFWLLLLFKGRAICLQQMSGRSGGYAVWENLLAVWIFAYLLEIFKCANVKVGPLEQEKCKCCIQSIRNSERLLQTVQKLKQKFSARWLTKRCQKADGYSW